MNDLFSLLVKRQLDQPQPVPAVPPNPTPRIPTRVERFNHAQELQDAYRNGWSPNPMLLRASQTK